MVVIAVQEENRSEGRVDTLVFRNALLKIWMFGQLASRPCGIAVSPVQFSKHCCIVVMPWQDSNVVASMDVILEQAENVDSKLVAAGVYANRDAGRA